MHEAMKPSTANNLLNTPSEDNTRPQLEAVKSDDVSSPEEGRKTFDNSKAEIVHGSYWPMDIRRDTGVSAHLSILVDGAIKKFDGALVLLERSLLRKPIFPK